MAKHKKRKLQNAPKKSSKTAAKATPQKPSKPTKLAPPIPFQAEDRILLVGEGDFSFAKSIVEEHGCCDVTATCFDSQTELFEKYQPQGEQHVQYLEDQESEG